MLQLARVREKTQKTLGSLGVEISLQLVRVRGNTPSLERRRNKSVSLQLTRKREKTRRDNSMGKSCRSVATCACVLGNPIEAQRPKTAEVVATYTCA